MLRLGMIGFRGLERTNFNYYQGSIDRYSCYNVHSLKYVQVYEVFTSVKHNLVAQLRHERVFLFVRCPERLSDPPSPSEAVSPMG